MMIEINWTQISNTTTNETIQYINETIINANIIIQQKTTLTYWLTGIILILAILIIFTRKKIKESIERNKKTRQLSEEILTEFKKLAEGKKVNEINIRDLPTNVQENILEHKSIISKMFFKGDKDGYKKPFMLLIRSDKTAEIKQGAKEGELIIQKKDAQKTKVRIELTASKIINIKVGSKYLPFWLVYEDEAEPLPVEPVHHAKQFYNIVLALQMTKNLIQPKKGKFPKILIIIGIVLVIGAVAYFAWIRSHPQEATTIIQNATNIANNISTINQTQEPIRIINA